MEEQEHPFRASGREQMMTNHFADLQLRRRKQQQFKSCLLWAAAMLIVLFLVLFIAFFANSKPAPPAIFVAGPEERRNQSQYSEWHDGSCKQQCQRSDFSKPPLVILSFDGFARDYLDRKIVKSLERLADCGATAERVFPSYPSKTFPNHYSMVTGLYPESHGVVDNNVFDPAVSPRLEYLATTKNTKFWMGDPIWSIYKRETGEKAACLYYAGCAFNSSGYPPDISPRYNKDFGTRNRLDRVRKWLNFGASERPGLITAYFDQPDIAGHYKLDEEDVNQKLVELDRHLDEFLTNLKRDSILDCINLVIVSDHGMQTLNKKILLRKEMDLTGLIGTPGVVSRIYINGSRDLREVTAPFECKKGEGMRVFTRKTMPVRKHFSRTPRVGDVIVQGEAGMTFIPTETDDWDQTSDHGYDYQLSSMQAVFFARGPAIKKGAVLPPFQNVEYLNLFMDLLELENRPSNNGTYGVLDDVLIKSRRNNSEKPEFIKECPLSSERAGFKACNQCSEEEKNRLDARLKDCSSNSVLFKTQSPQFGSSSSLCYQNYCNKTLLTAMGSGRVRILIENLSTEDEIDTWTCEITNSKYSGDLCSFVGGSSTERRYLSANMNSEFSKISSTEFNFGEGFNKKYFDVLNDLTLEYLSRFGRLTVISGIGYDSNLDGVMDSEQRGPPTHFYRILIRCRGSWSEKAYCENYDDLSTLAFILPIVQDEINCLPKEKLLLEYTARIRDVELLAGFQFLPRDVPFSTAVQLRTEVCLELWR